VDAGRGVAEGLRAVEIPVSQPDTIFLTNLLPENVVGLDDLLHAAWLDSRREALRLIGPPGTRALAEGLRGAHHRGLQGAATGLGLASAPGFEVLEVGGGWESRESWQSRENPESPESPESRENWENWENWESLENLEETRDDLRVRAGELGGGPTPALAYRFEWRERSVVVAGTGWAPDALVDLARGVDLLIHEASFSLTDDRARDIGLEETAESRRLLREASLHTSFDEVGSLASRAGVETLALVRLRPPPVYALQVRTLVGKTFAGRILAPTDGDEIVP
jgi:ribonuclease Z